MDNALHTPEQSSDVSQVVQQPRLCSSRNRGFRDGIAVVAVVILVTTLGIIFDFYEHFYEWTRAIEDWQVDEFFLVLLTTSLMNVWYAMRRRKDLHDEIASRRQVEAELRTSESRYRTLVEGSLQGMCIHQKSIIRFANHPLATLFGYDNPTQLIGQEIWRLMTPHARTLFTQTNALRWRGESPSPLQEWQGRRQDGALRWFESLQVPTRWEEGRGILMTVLDITERKQQDHVQQQLAYELHDGLAQLLVSAKYRLEAFASLSAPPEPQVKHYLERCIESIDQAILETRRLMARLRPVLVETLGLLPAVEYYLREIAKDAGWEVDYRVEVDNLALSPELEAALFRIVQEALHNARKHANTSTIAVRFYREGQQENIGVVSIQDGGQGFAVDNLPPHTEHFGLLSMNERARLLGGTCSIESQPGRGTTVTVRFPLLQRGMEKVYE